MASTLGRSFTLTSPMTNCLRQHLLIKKERFKIKIIPNKAWFRMINVIQNDAIVGRTHVIEQQPIKLSVLVIVVGYSNHWLLVVIAGYFCTNMQTVLTTATNHWTTHPPNQLTTQLTTQPTPNQPPDQPSKMTTQPTTQPRNHPTNHPTNQSATHTTTQPQRQAANEQPQRSNRLLLPSAARWMTVWQPSSTPTRDPWQSIEARGCSQKYACNIRSCRSHVDHMQIICSYVDHEHRD